MNARESAALDRYITGNYGEDQFRRALVRVEATCTRCGKAKRPTRGYLRLLKAGGEAYVCKACREAGPPPPMSLGSLGTL